MSNGGTYPQPPSTADFDGIHTALVCDVLDQMGYEPNYLGPDIMPLRSGTRLFGRVHTLLAVDTNRRSNAPYADLMGVYRKASPGDVLLLKVDGENKSGVWGELLSVAARAAGIAGAVVDGLVRDVDEIAAMDYPVFCRGASPLDSAGRQEVVETGKPLKYPSGTVQTGDYLLADSMGCVTVPLELGEEVVKRAVRKDRGEDEVRLALSEGRDITEVFDQYGIL